MNAYGEKIGPDAVRFQRLLPGPIERVWSYLTDSDKRATWLASGAMELKAGSRFEFRFNNSELGPTPSAPPERFNQYGGVHIGSHLITKCEPPHLLAFTWDEHATPSEVEFRLTPSNGKILLTITHTRLANRDDILDVSGGWHTHLDLLSDLLHGNKGTPFWEKLEEVVAIYEARHPE